MGGKGGAGHRGILKEKQYLMKKEKMQLIFMVNLHTQETRGMTLTWAFAAWWWSLL